MSKRSPAVILAAVFLLCAVGGAGAQGVTPQTLLPGALILKFQDPLPVAGQISVVDATAPAAGVHLVTPIYTGFAHTSHPHDVPTNADIADHTHDQEGLVNYTHPAHSLQDLYARAYSAKEMPVDVALGKVDSMDVMGSNDQANLPIWYRLLSCGLHVPASAGTDCFLNRITSRLPGSDRIYVHCAENFSYETWIANLRAGRTFVTNGPMLRLTVDDQEPGVTVRRQQPGELRVRGTATSQYPLDTLEIVVQGKVVKTIGAEGDRLRIDVDVPVYDRP